MKKTIVIVGGGTAGWMAALLFAHVWGKRGFQITLAESPDVPTIGVGEGSTPALKKYFEYLGIQETEWMPACSATYKTGIEFVGWSGREGYPSYFHPFDSELDCHTEPAFFYNCSMRQRGVDVFAAPDDYFITAELARQRKIPLPNTNFPFKVGYGYHFDAGALGGFLRNKAQQKGVVYRPFTLVNTTLATDGSIQSIHSKQGEQLTADLFVDCTGFASLLIEKALSVGFKSYKSNLFNDAAVTIQTTVAPLVPKTIATAMPAGWTWRIPLQNRTGYGYVYSRDFIDSDQAEQQLREYLGVLAEGRTARHLTMRVGCREKHWHKNCLALGLAQGFIEPLEATALNLVQSSIQNFIDAWELGGFTNVNEDRFNQRINDHFEGIRDYIVAHYLCSGRADTPYWLAVKNESQPSSILVELMQAWVQAKELGQLIEKYQLDRFYTKMSWYSLFSGYGLYMPQSQLKPGTAKANEYPVELTQNFIRACALNFDGI